MLERAERPLVLVGGALLADAMYDNAVFADLNQLAESWVLPISPTHRRPQLFDATHPNFGGYMGIRVPPALIAEMKRADLLVALGERMTDTVSQSYSFPQAPQPQLPFVHVWPDANEIGRVWSSRPGHPVQPARGGQGAAEARRAGRGGQAARLGGGAARDPSPAAGQGVGRDDRRGELRRHRLRGGQAPGAPTPR